jgi:hypothetical protein
MQEVIKYVADDGTEFEDEDECLDYERKTLLADFSNKGLRAFDCNKKELPVENYTEVGSLLDDSDFLIIPNAIKEEFSEAVREEVWHSPFPDCIDESEDDENLFYWSDEVGYWKNYKYELATLLELGQGLV